MCPCFIGQRFLIINQTFADLLLMICITCVNMSEVVDFLMVLRFLPLGTMAG